MTFCLGYLTHVTRLIRGLNTILGVFLLIITITATPLLSQEVIKFKDVLSEINYSKLLEAEKTAFEEPDRQRRAEMLSDLSVEAHVYNHQLAKNLFVIAIDSIKALPNDSLLAYTLVSASMPSIRMGEFEEAHDLISEAMTYYEPQKDSLGMASCFMHYALIERSRSRYYLSLIHI